jgi:hypothetical protein
VKGSIATVLAFTLSLAACSSAVEVTTTSTTVAIELPDRPELAVDQMVAALMIKDVRRARHLTSDEQLAILVALEGGGVEELAAMLQRGVPDEVAANFWTSFVEGFPDLVGESVEDMDFGTSIPRRIGGIEFMSFPVAFGTASAGTEWFVRLTEHGWQIDLLATFVGPFASALESLVRRTTDPDVLEAIRSHAPSIEAAYERHLDLGTSERVSDALKSLLEALSG